MVNLIKNLNNILNVKEKIQYEKVLENTPFLISDFYITDNEIFKCMLKKKHYSNLFFDHSIESIQFSVKQNANFYYYIEKLIEEKEWMNLLHIIEKRDILNSLLDL